MRIELDIDNYRHSIDSTDPELLGRWLVEMFTRVARLPWSPATFVRAQVYPSFMPIAGNPDREDWIVNMAVNPAWQVKSPREMVNGMARVLDELGYPK